MRLLPFFLACFLIIANILDAQHLKSNYSFKYQNGYYYLVDSKGKKVNDEQYSFACDFAEGLALVERELKFGFIDTSGKLVIDYQFYDAGSFVNGVTYAAIDGRYGYIDKSGSFIIDPVYDLVLDFNGNYADVFVKNKDVNQYGKGELISGKINKEGQLIGNEFFTRIGNMKDDDFFVGYKKDSVYHVYADGRIVFITTEKDTTFYIVDEMPQFLGGDKGLSNYIGKNLRYPRSAHKNSIMDKVFISFIVDANGYVVDVHPIKLSYPILVKEAVRVLETMPKWKPGKQHGTPVRVSYTIPIIFNLK